jgi:CheY-like chemotaxis protein
VGKRILVVDDSPYVADAFARLISHCGYETRTVYSGREATQQATAFLPDMVLMDICMPDQDGYETARQIRSQLGDAPLLLVAVTCLAETQDRQRALDSGFNFHVPKPVGLSTLYGLLANLNRIAVRVAATEREEAPFRHTPSILEKMAVERSLDGQTDSHREVFRITADGPVTTAACENILDDILRSGLPASEQRRAVEELFTRYAATLPNYKRA